MGRQTDMARSVEDTSNTDLRKPELPPRKALPNEAVIPASLLRINDSRGV